MESELELYAFASVAMVVFCVVWICYSFCQWIADEEEELQTAAIYVAGVDVDYDSDDSTTSSPHVGDANEPLDPEVLASLPVFVYSSSDEERKKVDPCAVCLMEFEDGEKGRRLLPCFHCFHVDCIDKWLSSHSACPLCRSLVGFLDV